MQNKAWFCLACSWILNCYRVDQSIASAWNGHFFHSSPVHSSESNRWHFSCLEEMIEGLKYEGGWGGGCCCCPFTFPLTHLQNLSAFFFHLILKRLIGLWTTGLWCLCRDWLTVPADGCSPSLCCYDVVFLAGVLTKWHFFFPSLKTHIHTQSKRRCWTQNRPDPITERTTSFISVPPRGLDTCRTACMSDALEPAAFRLFSPPLFFTASVTACVQEPMPRKYALLSKRGKERFFFFLFELLIFSFFFAFSHGDIFRWVFTVFFRRVWKTELRDVLTYM